MPENRTDRFAAALRYAFVLRTGPGAVVTTMKRTKRGLRTTGMAAVLASAAAMQLAVAQVSVDVSDCVELTKPEERLACFEAQVEAARNAPPAAAPPARGGSGRRRGGCG